MGNSLTFPTVLTIVLHLWFFGYSLPSGSCKPMNIEIQRKIDRYVGGFLCRLLSFCHFPWRNRMRPVQVDKVLVVLLSEMGSLVLATPMFRRLREKYPQARIQVLLFQKNREVLDLLSVVGGEDVITLDSSSLGRFARDGLGLVARLRRARFDVVIDCELFARVSSLLSFISGAPIRVGFHRHTQEGLYRGDFINRPVPYNPYHHLSQQFLTLVDAIDSETYPKAKRCVTPEIFAVPRVELDDREVYALRTRLLAHAPQVAGQRLILIYPSGGLLPIRAWPLEHYRAITEAFLAQGYAVGIIGMPDDKALAQQIQARCHHELCIDLTGFTESLRELMALFSMSSLLITNDGGPGQFAALSDIPTMVFFGPESPVLYGSLDPQAVVFFTNASCSPCVTAYNHRKSPCDGNNVCLKRIRPEAVLEKAFEILEAQTERIIGKPEEAIPEAPRIVDVPAKRGFDPEIIEDKKIGR